MPLNSFSVWSRPSPRLCGVVVAFVFLFGFAPIHAQAQCSPVTTVSFPVDISTFQLVQGFGVPSTRYQGRYHTGEDYYGGRGSSYGTPVHAIANGLVTYSAPNGWGRDGGVVIIQHSMPDGSTAYSMYGHMFNSDAYPFPQRFQCVQAGDVVGVVGDARPAPHLHLEIRTNSPDIPGPGYSLQPPTELGWLQPSKFILNWQAWLRPEHRWHLQLPDDTRPLSPPLLLDDGSLIILSAERVRFASNDGRVLSRIVLNRPAVALTRLVGQPLLTYADGTMQIVNFDSTLGESWSVGTALEGPAIEAGDLLLFHTPDNALVALGADRRSLAWRLDNIPPVLRAQAAPNVIGLITESNSLLSVSTQGQLIDTAQLGEVTSMAASFNGNLLIYAQDGYSEVDGTGTWSRRLEGLPGGGEESALYYTRGDSPYYFWSGGTARTLYARDAQGNTYWQTALPDVTGRARISLYDFDTLLLLTNDGYIAVVQQSTGLVCNQMRMYGDWRSHVWDELGMGNILRVGIADQIIGLDFKTLQGACANH
ncbi:MAG: M23 family metallopeptidase [Anaerolineae bacterium]